MGMIAAAEVTADGWAGWGCVAQQNCGVVRAGFWLQQSAQCAAVRAGGCWAMAQGVVSRRMARRQATDAKERRRNRIGFAWNAMV